MAAMQKHFPERFAARHMESLMPLFRWKNGGEITRANIQQVLRLAAVSHARRPGGGQTPRALGE